MARKHSSKYGHFKRGQNSWGRTNKNSSSFRQVGKRGKGGNSNFYPHGKPSEYAYTEHFVDVGHDKSNKAFNNTRYPGLDTPEGQNKILADVLANLDSLINGARAAELKFLADTGIDIFNMNGKDVFKAINEVLNSKDTFNRALQFLKQQSEGNYKKETDATYREVSKYFGSYLDEAIQEQLKGIKAEQILTMNPAQIKDLINNIISKGLELSYTRVEDFVTSDGILRQRNGRGARIRDGEQRQQAVSDMIAIIKELQGKGAFKEFGNLFNLNQDTLAARKEGKISFKRRKGNKYNNAQVDANYSGNALEVITSTVGAYLGNINITTHSAGGDLHIVGQHTGRWNNMKADTMLFVGRGDINIPDYLELVDNSIDGIRRQNVDALAKYYNKLEENVSHVIAISDKNYSIKANLDRGISAQTKMNLADVGGLLADMGVGQVSELIDYLANCGAAMVQGAVHAQVRTTLQSYIANFLFDNLEITGLEHMHRPSVNVVNLMNVSGVYMPLSVYLEGIRDSIKQVSELTPASLVSVTISLKGPTAQRIWTAGNWERFRQMREEQSTIEYKILKNLASFITNLAN